MVGVFTGDAESSTILRPDRLRMLWEGCQRVGLQDQHCRNALLTLGRPGAESLGWTSMPRYCMAISPWFQKLARRPSSLELGLPYVAKCSNTGMV